MKPNFRGSNCTRRVKVVCLNWREQETEDEEVRRRRIWGSRGHKPLSQRNSSQPPTCPWPAPIQSIHGRMRRRRGYKLKSSRRKILRCDDLVSDQTNGCSSGERSCISSLARNPTWAPIRHRPRSSTRFNLYSEKVSNINIVKSTTVDRILFRYLILR